VNPSRSETQQGSGETQLKLLLLLKNARKMAASSYATREKSYANLQRKFGAQRSFLCYSQADARGRFGGTLVSPRCPKLLGLRRSVAPQELKA
jgi:hypothetical protein